jgi:hypothetical protein
MSKTTEALKSIDWIDVIMSIIAVIVFSPILIAGTKVLVAAIKWSWNLEVTFDD